MRWTITPVASALAAVALAAIVVAAGPAAAFSRSGSTSVSFDGKTLQHDFKTDFDTASGDFSRAGTVRLPRGGTVTYKIDGSCKRQSGCTWSGRGDGPFGLQWSGSGTVKHLTGARIVAEGSITGPRGNVMTFKRDVGGDALPEGIVEFLR